MLSPSPPSSDAFYAELPSTTRFEDFLRGECYRSLPEDWSVVIADVRNSTQAIEAGRYKAVNGVGVAAIAALLNAVRPLEIPYVFGGDGVSACVPNSQLHVVRQALAASQAMAKRQFELDLRIGIVPLARIAENGLSVRIAKFQPKEAFQQALFAGGGISFADQLIKSATPEEPLLVNCDATKNREIFAGFECRWNDIPSPHEQTIALLVQATAAEEETRSRILAEVLAQIRAIYGSEADYHPLRENKLRLTARPTLLDVEAGIRTAFAPAIHRLLYSLKLQWIRLAGTWLMRRGASDPERFPWGRYKRTLIANTDYRKFDDVLRMVISGTAAQQQQLRACFSALHAENQICYGIHTAPAALITCVVEDYVHKHVHFLDAAGGGYALAARELKQQLCSVLPSGN